MTFASICEALQSDDDFPEESVAPQLLWLCQRGGFQALQSSAFRGAGAVNLSEYFTEHDKTLYYGVGFMMPGSVEALQRSGSMFCKDFEQLRKLVRNRGFEAVKTVNVTVDGESFCEYLQAGTSEWGLNPDLKAMQSFGVLRDLNVYWRVERLIAPLNYSPVKQFSAVFLAWPDHGEVQGVYLVKVQTQVGGALMSSTRARWKSIVAGTAEAAALLLK